jgi:tripartite-type tricarboxylate transporter receptor subunit TctC
MRGVFSLATKIILKKTAMKKIFFLFCLILSSAAVSQTTVPVVWAFSNTSSQGLMVREIINEANNIQKKYVFVFDHRPGSGGSVAVQHAQNSSQPAVLAHTASYFIRPHMNTTGAYDTDQFVMINTYCVNQPLVLLSQNIKSFKELDSRRDVTAGVLPGSITNLVITQLQSLRPNITFIEVGFKGTPEITTYVLGGHVDLSVDWLSSVTNDNLSVLGVTGLRSFSNNKTLKSQGLEGFDNITNSYYLFVNRNLDSAVRDEFNQIMKQAVTGARVQEMCRKEYGQTTNVSWPETNKIFNEKKTYWLQQINKK